MMSTTGRWSIPGKEPDPEFCQVELNGQVVTLPCVRAEHHITIKSRSFAGGAVTTLRTAVDPTVEHLVIYHIGPQGVRATIHGEPVKFHREAFLGTVKLR